MSKMRTHEYMSTNPIRNIVLRYNKGRSSSVGVNTVRKPVDTVGAFTFSSVKNTWIKSEVSELEGLKVT